MLIGASLILNSTGITGFAILEELRKQTGSILGIVLLIVGGLMLAFDPNVKSYRRHLEKMLGRKVDYHEAKPHYERARRGGSPQEEDPADPEYLSTKAFQRSIRGHNMKVIANAVDKIDTGKGGQHTLSNGEESISVTKGGRIIFTRNKDHEPVLKEFLSDHDYDTYMRNNS